MVEETKEMMDIAAVSTGVLSLAAWLPPMASLFTIVWMGLRIWESDTVMLWVDYYLGDEGKSSIQTKVSEIIKEVESKPLRTIKL